MLPCSSLLNLPDVSAGGTSVDSRQCVDIWWWSYQAEMDWNRICSELTSDERSRAATFQFEKDAISFIAGRTLQRSVLSQYTSIPAKDVEIALGPQGKPYIRDATVTFNLANTQGLVALAISRDCLVVGVDAELLTARIESETSSIFCSSAELATLSALRAGERRPLLLSYWTLKESLLKATGTGLAMAPDQLDIWLDRKTNAIRISNAINGGETCWHHRLLRAPSNHLIAISVQSNHAGLTLRQREFSEVA